MARGHRNGQPVPSWDLSPGYQSFAGWIPGAEASAVILANDEAADLEVLLKQLFTDAEET
jgi:hypothetical protein